MREPSSAHALLASHAKRADVDSRTERHPSRAREGRTSRRCGTARSSTRRRDASTVRLAHRGQRVQPFATRLQGPPIDPSASSAPLRRSTRNRVGMHRRRPQVLDLRCGDRLRPPRRNVGDRTARAGGRTKAARRGRQRPERRRGRGICPDHRAGRPAGAVGGTETIPGRGAEPGHARCQGTSADASMERHLLLKCSAPVAAAPRSGLTCG